MLFCILPHRLSWSVQITSSCPVQDCPLHAYGMRCTQQTWRWNLAVYISMFINSFLVKLKIFSSLRYRRTRIRAPDVAFWFYIHIGKLDSKVEHSLIIQIFYFKSFYSGINHISPIRLKFDARLPKSLGWRHARVNLAWSKRGRAHGNMNGLPWHHPLALQARSTRAKSYKKIKVWLAKTETWKLSLHIHPKKNTHSQLIPSPTG